jgi:hypothetical protein
VQESPDKKCRKFRINLKNYWIFSPNLKTDDMEAQPYSDRFPRHHILFSYRLTYLSNNTKITEKYEKTKMEFTEILPTGFHMMSTITVAKGW